MALFLIKETEMVRGLVWLKYLLLHCKIELCQICSNRKVSRKNPVHKRKALDICMPYFSFAEQVQLVFLHQLSLREKGLI